MRKVPLAEWFLSQDIGEERAAAIMGDLEELAATRGRLWFWVEYIRTLIALGWRSGGSAFILAFAIIRVMFGRVIPWLMNHRVPTLMQAGLFGVYNPHVRMITWNISMVTAQFLCFATPFVVIRFGMSNRLTRLACALFLISLPVYTLRPWIMDLSGLLSVLLIAAALVATAWRKQLAVLAGTCLPAVAVKATYLFLLPSYRYRHIPRIPASWVVVSDAISFAIAAIVCLKLYRWLLERPTMIDPTIA
ncbi:MAG TPA: hypothetical protein VMQ60_01000 [Acidobacteriaceae bacterium]|jgi:hypothetical protein|nr:hypothetical protein [Acidobacteriaceae bacterium]